MGARVDQPSTVITKDVNDFSVMPLVRAAAGARVVKIPAPLACYWLGLLEVGVAGRQYRSMASSTFRLTAKTELGGNRRYGSKAGWRADGPVPAEDMTI